MGQTKYRAFVAFSGGGAKGVVHVGALKAMEERGVDLRGVSGTSAGSIVATLAAAGFRSDELISTTNRTTILDLLNKIDPHIYRATDLFGPGWWRINVLRRLFSQSPSLARLRTTLWLAPAVIIIFIWHALPGYSGILFAALWLGVGSIALPLFNFLIKGMASVDRFRDALGTLLQQKMFPDTPGRVVRMSDFGRDGRPTLKIVSANLSTGSLELFSPDLTPTTPVADAVSASICLPVIFTPWQIGEDLHCDGGIVSNLPAWPFDEERELDPDALTIAVEIAAPKLSSKVSTTSWVPAAIKTALFGSGILNVRISGRTEQLALSTSFGLLDFDRSAQDAATEVAAVAEIAGLRLDQRLFRLPVIYRDACHVAQALVMDGLSIQPGGVGGADRVRVAVGRLERGYVRSLRLSYSVGYEDDTDESMLIPLEGSVAGAAWRDLSSAIELFPLAPERDMPGAENRSRRKLRWPDARWVMCIPIVDDETGKPRLLVQIDGNTGLPTDELGLASLEGVEAAIKEFFSLILIELRELEDGDDAKK